MKKFLFNIFIIIIIGTQSCSDFLDIRPQSELDPDFVFNSVYNAKLGVIPVYSILLRLEENCYRTFAYTADDATGNFNSNPDDGTFSLMRYDYKAINRGLELPFTALYAGIDRANICIEEIPKMDLYTEGSESNQFELKRLYGEALTLRALYYFELIKNWGDVPASFEPSLNQPDLFLPKTDRYVIYNTILNDLKFAADSLLPWRKEVDRDERITKGAAKALRARVALFAGGYSLRTNKQMERPDNYLEYYEIAKEECVELMQNRDQHTLNPSYESLFRSNCQYQKEPSGEFMLEIGFKAGETGRFGFYDGPHVTYPGYNKLGSTLVFALPTYFYAFDSLDVRRDVAVALGRSNFGTNVRTGTTLPNIVNGKFRIDWISPRPVYNNPLYTGVNFPIIRFSDVLLMFAEVDNELNNGPTAEAIAAFEEVRTRGFGGDASLIGVTPTNKDDFFEAIYKERLLEFGIEAIRKFDLIRWNRLASTLQKTKAELIKMRDKQPPYDNYPSVLYYKSNSWDLIWAGSFYAPTPEKPADYTGVGWFGTMSGSEATKLIENYAVFFEAGKNELIPYPQSVIDSNPKLSQDFGY